MGVKLRERKGIGWYVLTDWKGQRKSKFFGKNKALAKEFRDKLEAKLMLGMIGVAGKAGTKVEDYVKTWLDRIQCTRKYSTYDDYVKMMNRDILPAFHGLDLGDITRERVKTLAFEALKRGQAPKTVQNLIRCLSSMLSHAVEDELIPANAALKPGKFLPRISKRSNINVLTREEVALFLAKVRQKAPPYFPLFLCALRTGLRQGELVALQWGDIDFHGRFIEVQRNFTRGRFATPKGGESRRVDMSLELTQVLRDLLEDRRLEASAKGQTEIQPWVFLSATGGLVNHNYLRGRIFHGLLQAAELRRIRFHDLRHTFASLLLQQGESLIYVKEQMGHSSIQLTVDLYGHLIPGGNKQAVDRLDQPVNVVAAPQPSATQTQQTQYVWTPRAAKPSELPEDTGKKFGVSDGFRTRDLRIHNPAL